MVAVTTEAPSHPVEFADVERVLEAHRRELTGYCYRMLGSGSEAEDAVQETLVRAWRAVDRFEGRSSIRSWLYKIATNVCIDMGRSQQRRARPMEFAPAGTAESDLGPVVPEHNWVLPVPDAKVIPDEGDPAELAAARESIRLAFVAALQHLPPKQRAVLILREVLRWQATEVAELLDTSVASVNSALQRARATLAERDLGAVDEDQTDEEHQALLARYVDAFERYDIEALVSLIQEDAEFTMPPFPLWLRGTADIARWYPGQGHACEGSKLLVSWGNGCRAVGSYKPNGDGTYSPFALQIIEVTDGRISGLHHFLYAQLFAEVGFPPELRDE